MVRPESELVKVTVGTFRANVNVCRSDRFFEQPPETFDQVRVMHRVMAPSADRPRPRRADHRPHVSSGAVPSWLYKHCAKTRLVMWHWLPKPSLSELDFART